MNTKQLALIIGNSDGIGLGLTKRLLELGWQVSGLSRSGSEITHPDYHHVVLDVAAAEFPSVLAEGPRPDLCVFCAGIGEELAFDNMAQVRREFEVNLMGAIKTFEMILPGMVERKGGHIIMLSSMGDEVISAEAPAYFASKAGLTSYTESLALAARKHGVAVTNVRFGFVDTKMAKGDHRPMMMSVEKAVDYLMKCIEKRPIRYTRPRTMSLLVKIGRWVTRLRM